MASIRTFPRAGIVLYNTCCGIPSPVVLGITRNGIHVHYSDVLPQRIAVGKWRDQLCIAIFRSISVNVRHRNRSHALAHTFNP